jgi:gamma-glutamylaminecyclotransferase
MSPLGNQLVFVYGTLKRGGSNHPAIAGQTFCGNARTANGFRLFSLGEYPGMVVDPNDRDGVSGEVWSVDEACLARLDALEGVDQGLYRREPVALQPPFAGREVLTYIYAQNTIGRAHIAGGEWSETREG